MKNVFKQMGILIVTVIIPGILYSQTVEIDPKAGFQEIDGFGDCSMYGHLRSTYGYFNETQPEKLDEIADMLFTTNHPDSSFGFRFFHQVGIDFCLDETTMEYIPRSEKDNSDVLWYHQKLVERGGKVGLRHPVVDNFKYLDDQGRARIADEDIPENMEVIANVIEGVNNDYGYTFFEYTPMNESGASWWGSLNGSDAYLTNDQTVLMINEARKAFDNKGLNDVGLVAFDAFYINSHGRLDNMLNSDARQHLDHLSYHQYQNIASSQRYWKEQGMLKHGLNIWQTEWGNWDDLGQYERHAQAMTYAKRIFQALNVGKVSGWLAWELKFIFDINEQGWFPREAAWVMAQFSRFADPGMIMISTSDMSTDNQGTLAFIEQKSGKRDMSVISVNADATDKVLEYDLSAFKNMRVIDARITSESDYFKKIDASIDRRNKVLRMIIPGESTVSIRLNVEVDEILGEEANVYEAEDYSSMSEDNVFNNKNSGFTGLGYIDLGGVNSYIEWDNVFSNESQPATLVFSYTNGMSDDVTASISVNGSTVETISLAPSGGWGTWAEGQVTVNLDSGSNVVRFTGTSSNNRPIVDKMSVYFNGIAPATNLIAMADSENQITISWQDNSSGETAYIIERKSSEAGHFRKIAKLPADATLYADTNLISNRNYIYRVVAVNFPEAEPSETVSTKTNAVMAAPDSLAITSVNAGSISLSWNDNTPNEAGFIVYRREGVTGYYKRYGRVRANVTTYTDHNVKGNTEYSYVVRSFESLDQSESSNEVTVVGQSSILSPTNLLVSMDVDGGIKLSWTDNSNNEKAFVIQRAVGLKYWYVHDTIAANSTSYVDNDVDDFTTHYYRIQAINKRDVSTLTAEVSIEYGLSPTDGWKVIYVDSEELNGENAPATNTIDGDVSTIWHTEWDAGDPPHPHEIQISLGDDYSISGLVYIPRQSGSNGMIADYEFYVSADSSDWGDPVIFGTFENDNSTKIVRFDALQGSYIRLVALSEINGNPWASAAEINVIGAISNQESVQDGARISEESNDFDDEGIPVRLYPNPVHDVLHLSGVKEGNTVEIYNILGKRVLITNEPADIDVSYLKRGVYFIRIDNARNIKFIKN